MFATLMDGITRMLGRLEERSSLMGRMLDSLMPPGGDPVRLWCNHRLERVVRTCQGCRETDRCRTWLDAGGRAVSGATFCPNAEVLSAIIKDGHGRN